MPVVFDRHPNNTDRIAAWPPVLRRLHSNPEPKRDLEELRRAIDAITEEIIRKITEALTAKEYRERHGQRKGKTGHTRIVSLQIKFPPRTRSIPKGLVPKVQAHFKAQQWKEVRVTNMDPTRHREEKQINITLTCWNARHCGHFSTATTPSQ